VIAKIEEEVSEVRGALADEASDPARAEEEMGDLLFAIANLARKLGIEPEAALRKANDKFTKRFQAMERAIANSGRTMVDLSPEQLESEWQSHKGEGNYTNHKEHDAHKDDQDHKDQDHVDQRPRRG
jgi:uncharacterized protein YabN with tetrapyrrole methylase and pyrophosphatase domain